MRLDIFGAKCHQRQMQTSAHKDQSADELRALIEEITLLHQEELQPLYARLQVLEMSQEDGELREHIRLLE